MSKEEKNKKRDTIDYYRDDLLRARKLLGCTECMFRSVCYFTIEFKDGHCIKRECGYHE